MMNDRAVLEAARTMGIDVDGLTPWQALARLIGELAEIAQAEYPDVEGLDDAAAGERLDAWDQQFTASLSGSGFDRGLHLLDLAVAAIPDEPEGAWHRQDIPEDVLPFRAANSAARFATSLAYAAAKLETAPEGAARALDDAAEEFDGDLHRAWRAMVAAVDRASRESFSEKLLTSTATQHTTCAYSPTQKVAMMNDRVLITIQPGNTPDGTYDVNKPVPYPFHVDAATGEIDRQDFWKGKAFKVFGFQADADRREVDLSWEDAADDPERMVGMFAVLLDTSEEEAQIYSLSCPITKVTTTELAPE